MNFRIFRPVVIELWLPAALFAAWWFASASSTSLFFPPLKQMTASFAADWLSPAGITDLLSSVRLLLVGYALALFVGLVLGVLFGSIRSLWEAVRPVIEFLRSIPGVALLPVFLVLLGIGAEMKVVFIAFVAVWPVLLNTIDGVRSVEPMLLDAARVFRLGRVRRLFSIVLPGAGPQVFAGARTSVAIAVIVMVVSETSGSHGGVGYFLLATMRNFQIGSMWGTIILLGLLGYVLNIAFRLVEHVVLPWHRQLQSRLETKTS